ncbi:MAG: SDR family oxidoreductase [Phycisphaerales bacterium]
MGRPMAVVTGACRSRRVGAAIARALARGGCDLVLTHRDEPGPEHAEVLREVAALGATCRLERVDLSEPGRAEAWASGLGAELSRVDVLVHNASLYEPTPLATVTGAEIERHARVNVVAPLLMSRALGPALARSVMPGGGAIIAMCDVHALGETGQPRKGFLAYSLSKAALAEVVVVLARELAPGVRVNGVAPGVVAFPEAGFESDAQAQARYLSRVPMGRSGTPAEAAEVVRWLALDATYCTGQIIRVDGGRSLG